MGHLPNSKPAVRQAIPRRAKSSTTEYLAQLKQQKEQLAADGTGTGDAEHLSPQSRSAHVPSSRPSLANNPLTSMRPSLMKAASTRLLGGLGNVASKTGLGNVASGLFSRPKGDAQRLSDSDDDDDEEEFATNDSGFASGEKSSGEQMAMLRDFPSADLTKTPERRPRGLSCESQESSSRRPSGGHHHEDADVTRTPRRRPPGADSMWKKFGKSPKTSSSRQISVSLDADDDNDEINDSGANLYDDIDIDEDDDTPATPSRRIRQRMPRRPMTRRDRDPQGLVKSEHATPGKFMTPRQRLRRASLTAATVPAPMPNLVDLDMDTDEKKSAAPSARAPMLAGRRARRASLGHDQTVPAKTTPEPVATPEPEQPPKPQPDHRPRSRRRASIQTSNPFLQQTLAHMPQDPTHAVRGDLQEEWKRQEQMKDMRKRASKMTKMNKRLQGASMMKLDIHPDHANEHEGGGEAPLFEAEFSNENEEEAGADLELPADQEDVSDMSSNDGADGIF